MRKSVKTACLTCVILMFVPAVTLANGTKGGRAAAFDWEPVIKAIIEVESMGDPKAVDKGGKSCGILQITATLVKDCNRIQKMRNSQTRYTMDDRFNVRKSKEMFLLYQSYYNPRNDIEQAIRSWNGGMRYTKHGTQKYFEKVMRKLKGDVSK